MRCQIKASSGPQLQPQGAAVPRPTGQPALSAAPNRRKSETPLSRTARRRRRRAKRVASCAWTCGISDRL
eukprot:1805134-Alexandrium_andersonii.AAC.1